MIFSLLQHLLDVFFNCNSNQSLQGIKWDNDCCPGESYGGYGAPADYSSAAAPGYPAAYDYSAYYAQAGATPYGAYGQAPGAYPVADPYAQQYAAAAAAAAAPPAGSKIYFLQLCLVE